MSLQRRAARKIGIALVLIVALSGWRAEARAPRRRAVAPPPSLSASFESLWSWLTSWFLPGSSDPGLRPPGSHLETGCGMDPNGGTGECPQTYHPGGGTPTMGGEPPLPRR